MRLLLQYIYSRLSMDHQHESHDSLRQEFPHNKVQTAYETIASKLLTRHKTVRFPVRQPFTASIRPIKSNTTCLNKKSPANAKGNAQQRCMFESPVRTKSPSNDVSFILVKGRHRSRSAVLA